ncbi:hypothetical protein D9Y93_11985 [Enterococcus faecalis]|nr:hypothetical protein [Enterococcus faecalis]
MSYEITYDENISRQEKSIIVNNKDLYKICLGKKASRKNREIDVKYTLSIECDETGVNVQAVLPHEVMNELGNMISDSLEF